MDSGWLGKKRMNVEEDDDDDDDDDDDRLSNLPVDLIHKILSLIGIQQAMETSALSSRWRYIWTSMPSLSFTSWDFDTLQERSKFVFHVLSRRNNLTEVDSVKLSFCGKVSEEFVKRILNYALSHNVQQLNVVCLDHKDIELPPSLFSSQSLKHLSLTAGTYCGYHCFITPTSTWELPVLTTLDLHYVTLCNDQADKCVGFISKCPNLINLTLKRFKTMGSETGFGVSHPRLSNLTLEDGYLYNKVVNVTAPQLENLTIRFCCMELVIYAPALVSLFYTGAKSFHLTTDGFHSLEKADICVYYPHAHQIACLLQHLHNVKFLKLNLEIVEILSSTADQILHQPSPFVNLTSLKIYPAKSTFCNEQAPKKVAMSNELKSYLLDSSPKCTFTMVFREEILASKLLTELGVLLEKEKDDTNTNKIPVESHKPKKLKLGWNMAQIRSSWDNLDVQIMQRKKKAFLIISKLQRV
ncbi:F-box protein At4g22280-like [Bidens hawaiensis]|uniref:F-box protein At4g22280-like n=1 Tax=Bidens hawaiensis TaxID=980011 RepID=UPI004049E8BA